MPPAPAPQPVVIEVALNGVTTRARSAHVPVTAAELAEDAIACVDAGATVVHVHAEGLGGPPEELAETYAECFRAVLAERPGVCCYPTVGWGDTLDVRLEHVRLLAAEGLITASFCDPGSVNLGGAGRDGLPPDMDFVYRNSFAETRRTMALCEDLGLGPSIAVFEPGFLQVVLAYSEAGRLPPGALVKLYFAAGGYLTRGRPLWGVPPIRQGLDLYRAMLEGSELVWAVAVVGGSLVDSAILDPALAAGAHVRVGLEDDQDGPSNAEQVTSVVQRIHAAGRGVATLDEMSEILGLRPTAN